MTQGSAGLSFELVARDGEARTGRLGTAHGIVRTPAFMPVGTAATVKAMTPSALKQTGAEIVLANTYHLMLRPGAETIAALGGLHRFMNWDGPLLTDSGGYQVMSLASLRELSAHGVVFRSHLDGSRHELSPERCIEIQGLLGVDIAMALDECTPFPVTEDQARDSMRLTLAWAERCLAALGGDRAPGALFGIVQGGVFPALRAECAARLVDMNFDGYALGGLAVGEGTDTMLRVVADTAPQLPAHKPRYLMGVGKSADVVAAVARGIDLFDCVLPTRSGRTGQAFTRRGPVALRNARHAADARPLDSTCSCPTCTGHSRAYLHHLFRAREMLGPILLTRHNLTYYQDLMADLRAAIEVGGFAAFADTFSTEQARGDIGAP